MKVFIAGGAGFIGSHIAHRILKDAGCERLIIYDNFTSGKEWHIADIVDDARVTVVRADIKDLDPLVKSMAGNDMVFHFASNPDIAKAMTQPDVDFLGGNLLNPQYFGSHANQWRKKDNIRFRKRHLWRNWIPGDCRRL